MKFPFIVLIHKENKIIEFRFDVIKNVYFDENYGPIIYVDMIQQMQEYIKTNYHNVLIPMDMNFMVQVAKDEADVILIAEYLRLSSGGNAQLEVGNNQEYMLPFIGELRALLIDYQSEFEKAPILKEALEQYMYEKEEMSDYPWIQLKWKDDIKTRSFSIKLTFDYMNKNFCLVQHYYNNVLVGMERMNYVVKYFSAHRNIDKPKTA